MRHAGISDTPDAATASPAGVLQSVWQSAYSRGLLLHRMWLSRCLLPSRSQYTSSTHGTPDAASAPDAAATAPDAAATASDAAPAAACRAPDAAAAPGSCDSAAVPEESDAERGDAGTADSHSEGSPDSHSEGRSPGTQGGT